MRSLSLGSIRDVLASNDDELIASYFNYLDGDIKEKEKEDFLDLINILLPMCSIEQQSGFFVSQVTKSGIREEFDFLRFSNESIINIESKHEWPKRHWKCLDQLKAHDNILKLLNKEVYCYTYISDTKELYVLNNGELKPTDFSSLIEHIPSDYIDSNCLDDVDYSSMLISPYSDPVKFYEHKYVLTNNQDEIKKKIIDSPDKIAAIHGRAGTGKSLLLMDIARYYKELSKKVLVLLCRNFNEKDRVSRILGIDVEEIKKINVTLLNEYNIILVDEAQRIYAEHFDLIKNVNAEKIVFSLDPEQTLHDRDIDILGIIRSITQEKNIHEISDRIRANDAIEMFSRKIVHLNCRDWDYDYWKRLDTSCIHISYFSDETKCVEYLQHKHEIGKTIIEFTPYVTKTLSVVKRPMKYRNSRNPHNVLGEEFDDVVVVLDSTVAYRDRNGEMLIGPSDSSFYPHNENHSVYEAVTRAKKSLEIVVLNNPVLFKTLTEMFDVNYHDNINQENTDVPTQE
jgi:hypothetical protein